MPDIYNLDEEGEYKPLDLAMHAEQLAMQNGNLQYDELHRHNLEAEPLPPGTRPPDIKKVRFARVNELIKKERAGQEAENSTTTAVATTAIEENDQDYYKFTIVEAVVSIVFYFLIATFMLLLYNLVVLH